LLGLSLSSGVVSRRCALVARHSVPPSAEIIMFFGCCLRHRRFFNPVIKGGRCLPLLFGEPKRREGLSCEIIMAYG
jgi:hypothetical protein